MQAAKTGQAPDAPQKKADPTLGIIVSLLLIFGGCALNNLALEFIISKKRNAEFADKTYGAVLTLLQFLLIAVLSLQYVCEWKGGALRLKKMTVPWQEYAWMAVYFSVMSILNNLAFAFNISQPMHMVFRSSNLMVSYLYGYFLLKKRYTWQQLVAVALLTLGALCATWAEMSQGDTAAAAAKPCANCGDSAAGGAAASAGGAGGGAGGWAAALFSDAEGGALYLLRWWMGIGILVLVLGLQTRLGALQEACKGKYGENPFEMLFFFHFFSLPAFFFCVRLLDAQKGVALWANVPSLLGTLGRWSASHSLERELALNWGVSTLGEGWGLLRTLGLLRMPIMWVHVTLNCVTQFFCLVGVYTLISQVDQLSVNVALTVRKFLSLMLSIWVFNNKFTGLHWVGALLVIGGSYYFGVAPKVAPITPAPLVDKESGGGGGGGGEGDQGGEGGAMPQLFASTDSAGARNRAALAGKRG